MDFNFDEETGAPEDLVELSKRLSRGVISEKKGIEISDDYDLNKLKNNYSSDAISDDSDFIGNYQKFN